MSGRRGRATPWMEDFRRQLADSIGITTARPNIAFTVFDRLDDRLLNVDLTRSEVLAQVRGGIFQLYRSGGRPDRPNYRMVTEDLELTLHTEPWISDPGRQLVVLDRAAPRRRSPLSEWLLPVVPASVTDFSARDGQTFDIDSLSAELDRRRDLVEAGHTLTKVRLTPRRHAELRAEIRRRYGSLRALLQLAKKRADLGDNIAESGVVVDGADLFATDDPRRHALVIRMRTEVAFSDEEGSEVSVWSEDDATDARPFTVTDYTDGVLVLTSRRRSRFEPGTSITVAQADRFRYHRHSHALKAFFEERDIVGNWTSLATLLCRPEDLAAPPPPPELGHTVRPLNREQRRAVGGALTAPHTFFVQGPPGTGKTQVITELVSRLTARGERVLLTAPTHVAVDEVLSRLGQERGVLPIRLSFSDTKVAPSARRYTQSSYDSMLSRDVRLPTNSEQPQRLARIAEITDYHAALVEWQAVQTEHETAQRVLDATRTQTAERQRQRQHTRAEINSRLSGLVATATAHSRTLTTLYAAAADLHHRIALLTAARGTASRIADLVGVGALARTRSHFRRAERDRIRTGHRYLDTMSNYDAARAHADGILPTLDREDHQDRRALADAEHAATRAATDLARCRSQLQRYGLDDLAEAPWRAAARIEELEAEKTSLAARIEVQQRWFDLCGTNGEDETADRTQAAKVVGRALSSAINLVCSTTTGFGGNPDYRDLDFDTLIVDEASKVTGADFLIPAIRARRWILVGDEKQLPPYVESRDEHHIHAMAAIHATERDPQRTTSKAVRDLADLWQQREDSEQHPFRVKSVEATVARLLASGAWKRAHRKVFTEQITHITDAKEPERELLRVMDDHLVRSLFEQTLPAIEPGLRSRLVEQRRMPWQIAELVRKPVYDGAYKTPDDDRIPTPLVSPSFPTPVVFLDTSAQPNPWDDESGTSSINRLEANWVVDVCEQWEQELRRLNTTERTKVSVLSFYAAQAKLIRGKLGAPGYTRFTKLKFKVVDSIDRIQGQESDLVLVSFCRTYGKPKDKQRRPTGRAQRPSAGYARWLQNLNRLNVASTRARRSLILIGHANTLSRLHGVPGGEAFYANLFALPGDVLTVRREWAPAGQGRRRR
jgi:hypothetical protein